MRVDQKRVDDIFKEYQLCNISFSRRVSLQDVHGVDYDRVYKNGIPDNASIISINRHKFQDLLLKHILTGDQIKVLYEAGFIDFTPIQIWSHDSVDEVSEYSISEGEEDNPISVNTDMYVIYFKDYEGDHYVALNRVLSHKAIEEAHQDLQKLIEGKAKSSAH